MKKTMIFIALTILIEIGLSFAISMYFNTALIPVMFFVGLLFIGVVLFFTSSGGTLTNFNAATAQAQIGIPIPHEEMKLKGSPALWGAGIYFLISILLFILFLSGLL